MEASKPPSRRILMGEAALAKRPFSSAEIEAEARRLHAKLQAVGYPVEQCRLYAPLTLAINRLKKEKNAVILAHNYQRAEVLFGIADFIGDSLELARKARDTQADIILFCGVKFMAETAKILTPAKKVLIPDMEAGCSLAESISAADVKKLRAAHPEAAVVSYVNTYADVKAESDVCCTSANALKIVEALPNQEIVFLPDNYMARNIQAQTPLGKKIMAWKGLCIVHETFRAEQIAVYRKTYPGIQILAHLECHPDVVKLADYVGGTSGMAKYVAESQAKQFMLVTECGMSDVLRVQFPGKQFIVPCALCPYMKKIHLEKALDVLIREANEITVPEPVRAKAERALQKMFELTS